MDDIYGDLENYEDVNELQELRNDNIELKSQVQKKTLEIEKLQKDYDKLASDYKKLEINYSSLLKTARAEVERKTQMINNLNLEKDMMVLNSIQNCHKISNIRRNMARDKANSFKINRRDFDSVDRKSNKNSKDMQESKKFDPPKNRIEEKRLPSVDTVSSTNTDDTNKLPKIQTKQAKLELFNEDNGESKENVAKVKSRAQSIRNRRKSMPIVSKQSVKFSSDEEFDDQHSPETADRKGRNPKEDKSRRVSDKNYNDKQRHKVSETSGIDEKYSSYHESSRETYYKSKDNRYSDKYRNTREKYDERYTKHYSPDRPHRRMPRDYSDERHPRSEYGRYRVLESPPIDRYDSQRRRRDRRPYYDRENPEERHLKRHCEKLDSKHKTQSDNDEPYCKRARIDSFKRHPEEDKTQYRESEVLEGPVVINKKFENLHDISCQSPDYVHADTELAHPIREIMDTAATHLEDPRLTSKKYITKTEDNKVILSTVDGRNVDFRVVNKSAWDIPRVDIPEALRRPPEYADKTVQDVYMDIDNPILSNLSMESGEIHSEANSDTLLDSVTKSYLNDYTTEGNSQKNVRDFVINVQQEKIGSKVDSDIAIKQKDATDYPKQLRELDNMFNYGDSAKVPRYKSPTTNSSVNDNEEDIISQNYTSDFEKNVDVQKTITGNIRHGFEKDGNMVFKEHVTKEHKGTEKATACVIKNTERYVNDKVSQIDVRQNINDITQKETKPLPGTSNLSVTTKHIIPKVRQADKHTVSRTTSDDKHKETEKTTPCIVSENTASYMKDEISEKINQMDASDIQQETKHNTGTLTIINKYKIPKVKKPDDTVKPLERLLDDFNSTNNCNKKRQGTMKNTKKYNTKSRQDVYKPLAHDDEHQDYDLGGDHYKDQIRNQREFREVVEGDLELSDETSDNIEINTQNAQGIMKNFECIEIHNRENIDKKDPLAKTSCEKYKRGKDDAKNQKSEQCSGNIKIIIKRVSEEKTEPPTSESSRKQKRKKSHKHKGTHAKETSKSTESDEIIDKNIPKKEATSKEIKAKFTDLFGDSSSLITPEDLGVITAPTQTSYPEKYVSIFDDAQDAIDVNVKKMCNSQTSSIVPENDTIVEETKSKEAQKTYSSKTSKSSTEGKQKKSKKSNVEKSFPIVDTIKEPNLFLNLIPETVAKEPDVNTVIISTGVQPQITSDEIVKTNVEQHINNNIPNEIQNSDNRDDIASRIQPLPSALATSTPYKSGQIEADGRVPESSRSSSDKVERDDSSQAEQISISNGLNFQNDVDAPDVRIFVRRRRKVVRKT